MSNSDEQALGQEEAMDRPETPDQEWEATALAWLSTLPEGHALTIKEVEAWVASNQAALPEKFKSLLPSQLHSRLASIKNSVDLPDQAMEGSHARFKRTGQWLPVYSWLESLNKDEVVKSKDIADWLSQNPKVEEQLYSRHTRYHLMHYIKKCHVKILKRKDKRKGVHLSDNAISATLDKPGMDKQPVLVQCKGDNNLPADTGTYISKRNEAFRKYEILLQLEKQLFPVLSKQ